MSDKVDVVVLGAGPAGVHAAMTAARYGLSVVLVDQNHAAGGQVFRPMPATFVAPAVSSTTAEGDEMRMLLTALKRFTKNNSPINTIAARQRVADVLIEANTYVF